MEEKHKKTESERLRAGLMVLIAIIGFWIGWTVMGDILSYQQP